MSKKRVDVTIDTNICNALDQIRKEPKDKPSLSQVINRLLSEHNEIKKRLKKNGK